LKSGTVEDEVELKIAVKRQYHQKIDRKHRDEQHAQCR
jgi:hypothetical protein